jgi:hypothetical protein
MSGLRGEDMHGHKGPCQICGNPAEHNGDEHIRAVQCPRCGRYQVHATRAWLKIETADHMVRLSGWIREQNAAGIEVSDITPEISRAVAQRPLPGLKERSDRVLAFLAREFPRTELYFVPDAIARSLELQGVAYCRDYRDATLLIHILEDENFLRGGASGMFLTIRGILAAEALGRSVSQSAQCFVAMSFDESLKEAYTNGFYTAIGLAGYRAFRIDGKDYVGGISDEMIAEIRRSRFMVADYTLQSENVYFEAGFGLGLGLVVIPTCREDEAELLHFDIRHLNALRWKDSADLMDKLSQRIRAVLGAGPYARDD